MLAFVVHVSDAMHSLGAQSSVLGLNDRIALFREFIIDTIGNVGPSNVMLGEYIKPVLAGLKTLAMRRSDAPSPAKTTGAPWAPLLLNATKYALLSAFDAFTKSVSYECYTWFVQHCCTQLLCQRAPQGAKRHQPGSRPDLGHLARRCRLHAPQAIGR